MSDFTISFDYALLSGAATFTYALPFDYALEGPLPSFTYALRFDWVLSAGTLVLIKIGDTIVETQLKMKLGRNLVTPDPVA